MSKVQSKKTVIVTTLEEILPMFGIQSKEAKNVVAELCSYHGIIVKLTEETYGFGHLALQEYLAAKWYASEQRWLKLITPEIVQDFRLCGQESLNSWSSQFCPQVITE